MKIALVKYFNGNGRCVYRLGVEEQGGLDPKQGDLTSEKQAALGIQALISQVVSEEVGIQLARKVRTVGVNDRQPVAISTALPELERGFGATSVQWAHAIFTHLKLKPPALQ